MAVAVTVPGAATAAPGPAAAEEPLVELRAAATAGPGTVAGAEPLAEMQATAAAGLGARAAALVLSGQEAGDLPAAMLALPLPARDGGPGPVLLIVDLEGPLLLATAGGGQLEIELYVYALDAAGAVSAHLTQTFEVDPAKHAERLSAGGVKFVGDLELPPGAYTLRLLVVERSSDRFRLRSLPLTVPARPESRRLLAAAHPPADWLVVRQGAHSREAAPRGVSLRFEAWLPGAAAFAAGVEAVSLVVAAGGLGGDPASAAPAIGSLEARLETTSGERVLTASLVGLEPAGTLAGIAWSRAELPVAGLPAGHYALRVATGTGASGQILELRLVDPEIADAIRIEREVTARPGTVAHADAGDELAGARPAVVYGAALRRLAGRDPSARAELAAAEQALLAGGSAAAAERMTRGFAAVAARLAGEAPEALVPLLAHHEALVREHHAAGRYLLARHSRRLLGRLLDLYSAASSSPEGPRLAADARLAVAGHLLAVGAHQQARQLCERALEADPEHAGALLLVAAIDEAYGDYSSVVRRLRPLVEAGTRYAEADLRLAINLRRTGDAAGALPLLRGLIRTSNEGPARTSPGASMSDPAGVPGRGPGGAVDLPEWVTAVAHQELADLLMEAGDAAGAAGLLENAVARWPEFEQLSIQLLATLDRLQRPAAAQVLLARLGGPPTAAGDTPRLVYSRWPTAGVEQARRELTSAAAKRLPQLGKGLAAAGLAGEGEPP